MYYPKTHQLSKPARDRDKISRKLPDRSIKAPPDMSRIRAPLAKALREVADQ
jgi:hypothetical protein